MYGQADIPMPENGISDTELKMYLYSKDPVIANLANIAVGIGIGSISSINRTQIKYVVNKLASKYLLEPTLVESEAIKYLSYLTQRQEGPAGVYSVGMLLRYEHFYNKETLKLIEDNLSVFRDCYKFAHSLPRFE